VAALPVTKSGVGITSVTAGRYHGTTGRCGEVEALVAAASCAGSAATTARCRDWS